MQVVLVALNAKYSHSSLALRYLKSYVEEGFPNVETLEFNINQDLGLILAELARRKPDVVGFSCYIWNIELILPLVGNLRKVCPNTTIILGGPEVSFDTEYWLRTYPEIDFLISGKEEALRRFLEEFSLARGALTENQLQKIPGLVYRAGKMFGQIPGSPGSGGGAAHLRGDLRDLQDKIVLRNHPGCPYPALLPVLSDGAGQEIPESRSLEELRRLAKQGWNRCALLTGPLTMMSSGLTSCCSS